MINKKFIFIELLTVIFLLPLILNINISYAFDPEEVLKEPKLEKRARDISKNVRCLVCQNQSIDDSSAPLAKDLRILIRNKIKEGMSDKEIYSFLTDRYGDFVLFKPPLKNITIILWILPFALFIIALSVVYWHNKKSKLY